MSAPVFLQRMKFRPQVDEERCVNCGSCVEACSTGALEAVLASQEVVAGNLCRNCRSCIEARNCGALRIVSWFDRSGSTLPVER